MSSFTAARPFRPLAWWRDSTPAARRALTAAALGWMLDSFDVMLYALVLSALMHDLHLSKTQAGILGSVALIAAAFGGIVFGWIADRFGRTRALIGSVFVYAVFTAACGLAQSLTALVIFRIFLGLGMGGEWASGAALVSETWPPEHRGKALGLVQSSWAIGYALAAVVTAVVMPRFGWRAVFFVGVAPALLTLFIRRKVADPETWRRQREVHATPATLAAGLRALFIPERRALTLILTLMNACTLFAWWGFNLWVPAFLSLPADAGGRNLSTHTMATLVVVMQIGMWLGYVTFGFVSDRLGRKPCYIAYLFCAAVTVALYGHLRDTTALLLLGPVLAFFGTGYYTGFAAVTSELYPTEIRATAQGFTYNLGRIASALAPFLVGNIARLHGFSLAFALNGLAFLCAAALWIWIPETHPRRTPVLLPVPAEP